MEEQYIDIHDEGAVRWLTLCHERSRNALSSTMIAQLHSALEGACASDAVRVIVLAARGKVFSAGHDLSEITRQEGEDLEDHRQRVRTILERCAQLMLAIVHAPKPVIACVTGIATAAGCQLVSACDMAIAGQSARFATPGVNVGFFCTTPLVGIGRNVSRKHAMEMALTGDMITAQRAETFGLVNQVVDDAHVVAETQVLAQKIASKSAQGIRGGKERFYRQIDLPLEEAFEMASCAMLDAVTAGGDADEGPRAFFEKRDPQWK